jgi:perosamine synthetase
VERIPLFKARIRPEAADAARETILSGWPGMGPKVVEFEKKLAHYIDPDGINVIALNSGTAALHIAMHIAKENRPEKKYVLTTPITFVSTNHAIKYVGLEPVFADIEWWTGNMEFHSFCEAIRRYGDHLCAIVVVHYGGQPVNLYDMKYYLHQNNLSHIPIIEDCAHAMGGNYLGNTIGRGDMCCFSFHAVKNLPMGDGGALTCYNKEWAEKARRLRWLGIDKSTYARANAGSYTWKYDCPDVGYKSHMDDVHAAIGIHQLDYLDKDNARRAEIAKIYTEEFSKLKASKVRPLSQKEGRANAWHLFVVRFNRPEDRDSAQSYLREQGIGTGVHYIPNTHFAPYQGCVKINNCEGAEDFYQRVLSLPMHLYLKDEDVKEVVQRIGEAL